MNNRAKPEQLFQIGVKWLVKNKDGLYLCLTSSEGYFDLPGGRIAEGENIIETLKNELSEEAGIAWENIEILSEWKILWTDKYIKSHPSLPRLLLLVYICKLKQEPSIQLSHEHIEYSWETARDLYEKVTILQSIPFENIFE
jgi:8-oxo-dGTP pyrophosphatase MutT (NUDIX family)